MIVFDIECESGHRFEGWFDDLRDLEAQIAAGLVCCPVCESTNVRQIPSTFGVNRASSGGSQEDISQALTQALKRYVKENFDDVGTHFASEALKIHYGASDARNIRGVSTAKEEEMLQQEGVSFFKFPDISAGDAEPPQLSDDDGGGGGDDSEN